MRSPLTGRAGVPDSPFLFCLELVIFFFFKFWILQWPHYVYLSPRPVLLGTDTLLCQPLERSCLQASATWGSLYGDGSRSTEVFWSRFQGILRIGNKSCILYPHMLGPRADVPPPVQLSKVESEPWLGPPLLAAWSEKDSCSGGLKPISDIPDKNGTLTLRYNQVISDVLTYRSKPNQRHIHMLFT